jgi:hypothetical protein
MASSQVRKLLQVWVLAEEATTAPSHILDFNYVMQANLGTTLGDVMAVLPIGWYHQSP